MDRSNHGDGGKSWNAVTAILLAAWALAAAPALAEEKIIVGLITKTNTNPFFAKMKEGAEAKAKELRYFRSSPANTMATTRDRWTPRAPCECRRQGDLDHPERHQGDRSLG